MSDPNGDPNADPRAELAAIAADLRDHLEWLRDAGVTHLKREQAAPSFGTPVSRAAMSPAGPAQPRWTPPGAAAPPPRPPPTPAVTTPVAGPVLPKPPPAPVEAVVDRTVSLRVIREELGNCTRCKLAPTRTNIVFGQGNPNAELVFVGEGPGADEDASGLPFVGRAGELLTKMIVAMGYTREQVYICNVVKCRPPDNRTPEDDEVAQCRPFLEKQLLAIKPRVVVVLGSTAAQRLLRISTGITRLRGTFVDWNGIPVMPTFHPSYLLRAPEEKGKAWNDLKLVLAKLGKPLPAKG